MVKHIDIELSPQGVRKAIVEYKAWRKDFEAKCAELVRELGREGVEIARMGFETAVYDGTNDVQVEMQEKGDYTVAVVATGEAVLFIEFGTGVTYPDTHPEAGQLGMARGGYGLGQGSNIWGWTYDGDPGTNGMVIYTGFAKGRVHTFGNPANMSMYNAKSELEEKLESIARRVFS